MFERETFIFMLDQICDKPKDEWCPLVIGQVLKPTAVAVR